MEHRIGKHSYRVEDDVVLIKFVGTISFDEMRQMAVIKDSGSYPLPTAYMIYDVSHAGMMSPEARRYSASRSKLMQVTAILIHGTTLFTRAATALVMSTVRLLGKDIPQFIVRRVIDAARRVLPDVAMGDVVGHEHRHGAVRLGRFHLVVHVDINMLAIAAEPGGLRRIGNLVHLRGIGRPLVLPRRRLGLGA